MSEQENFFVEEVSSDTFFTSVIEGSKDKAIIVDFWAPWCNPCKQLTPIIANCVINFKDKLKLVKVNIDDNQALAQQLRIQSVPTVLAFYEGKPVNGFTGLKSSQEVTAFLTEISELASHSSDQLQQINNILEKADKKLIENNFEEAVNDFVSLLGEPIPKDQMTKAIVGLGKCYLGLNKFDDLEELLSQLEEDIKNSREIKELIKSKNYLENIDAKDIDGLNLKLKNNLNDHETRLELARSYIANKDFSEAIENLLYIIDKKKDWKQGIAKKELLDIFTLLGDSNDLTLEGRAKLSNIIFK